MNDVRRVGSTIVPSSRFVAILLAFCLLGATAPQPTLIQPDGMMDTPQPKAPLSLWTDAPGRTRITLAVPGALVRGYRYAGSVADGPVLIVFGGSGNMIKNHDAAARGFARSCAAVIWYDYRGYGFSSGTAHFETLWSDGERVYDAVRAEYPLAPMVALGYSMGTDIANHLALHRMLAGLILAAPWSDTSKMYAYGDAAHVYRFTARALADFDQPAMIEKVAIPLLVIQGTRDDSIPPSQGPALEKLAASHDKAFVPIVGAKHNGLLENPQSQRAIATFLHAV